LIRPRSRKDQQKKGINLLIGTLLGLMGGVGIAYLLEAVHDSVNTAEDVETKLNLPCLGAVPDLKKFNKYVPSGYKKKGYELLVHDLPRSPLAEAVNNVDTCVRYGNPGVSINTMVVSSPVPREGKSFLTVSLAAVAAARKERVLVVDADLRRPRIAEIFDQPPGIDGFTTLLNDRDVPLRTVIQGSRVPGLYFMAAGPAVANPSALFKSERLGDIVKRL
jgi:hypothetical protein